MSKHTPGPWEWQGHWLYGGDWTVLWYTTADDGVHCTPADARLIAAAPGMLEALEYIRDRLYLDHPLHKVAADALAKVNGEEEPRTNPADEVWIEDLETE